MARFILTTVIALHGIIHLIGFSKEWKLGPGGKQFSKTLIPFSENASKIIGVLWLAACIFILASAWLYFQKQEWYWIPAVIGLVISQTLIIIYWHDAKYGTIINLVVLVVVIIGAGVTSYNKLVQHEIKSIITKPVDNQLITSDDIVNLPNPVQRWLSRSGIVGKQIPQYVHVVQRGAMRTNSDADWMSFNADQYFTIQEPAFVWSATIKASIIPIVGRDKFIDGHGNMLIKPLYIYEMANSSGAAIDQGTLLRYLAEMMWFPHAAIKSYLTWEEIDNHHAIVTMNYKGVSVTGTFTFNNEGDAIGFEAMRYGEFNGEYRKERWSIVTTNHKSFQGINVGTTSEVTWKLKTGDFLWLKMEIDDISYYN